MQSSYSSLKDKWSDKHRDIQKSLFERHKEALDWFGKHARHFAVGSFGSFLLFAAPVNLQSLTPSFQKPNEAVGNPIDPHVFLISDLQNVLPDTVGPLTTDQEEKTLEVLRRYFRVGIAAEIDNKRLERNYGLIGQEQHLPRYPSDTLMEHFTSPLEEQSFSSYGMTQGLGAFGYFSSSKAAFTHDDYLREKYYIAVQTFLSKEYDKRASEYNAFYKFRKMLLVNPQNGKAIVCDIADAGPAVFTGKHLGGSPEVMKYLERVDGARRGPVLYFFVNDSVPLGPIVGVQS